MRPAKLQMSSAEEKALLAWQELCARIAQATPGQHNETEPERERRKSRLQSDFSKFCTYYFPHYCSAEFGWFHLKAARTISQEPDLLMVAEWPREHAKSVFFDVMIPLWLYAKGEMSGMMLASASFDKAKGLLGDIQAEFEANQRYIEDYGYLVPVGDWRDGAFTTTDGIGFWAFGRGQSPRGTRKADKRPNYGVIDDIDDKVIVRNEQRVREAVDWVLEDFYGALAIDGARLVIAGNRIHKASILAHLVGDVEPDDPKRQGLTHIKVFAIEDAKHNKAEANSPGARPAWIERYTIDKLMARIQKMGTRAGLREFFHEHHEEGFVFRFEWIQYRKPIHWKRYDNLIAYVDPSFKDTKDNDYKGVVLIGNKGKEIDVLRAWVRQASVGAMVSTLYDWYEIYGAHARYYMEANFVQDLLMDDVETEGIARGYQLPLRKDTRAKPQKEMRIENISPIFERGLIFFSESQRKNPDMITLINQILGFPYGHDDGPDALEGAISKIAKRSRGAAKSAPRVGTFNRKSERQ